MAATYKEFLTGLYEEHLAEASFLYQQRRSLLGDPATPWSQLADWEERLEAHIDALVIGGELALEICREHVVSGEAGEAFAAIAVFCRHERAPLLSEALRALDEGNGEMMQAAEDALRQELPRTWTDFCVRGILHPDRKVSRLLASVSGYQRLASGPTLHQRLAQESSPHPALLWATGRIREAGALDVTRLLLRSEDGASRSAALQAAVRLHDAETREQLVALVEARRCPPLILGLAGGRDAARLLVGLLDVADLRREAIAALGLLGDLSAVRPLLASLGTEEFAADVADALEVITGASVYENATLTEPVDEDELFEEELAAYRATGEVPKRPDGRRYGTDVRRLSRDPAAWNSWIGANASRFVAGRRYRRGLLYQPAVLLEDLTGDALPKRYRSFVMEELLIRYRIDLALEADMPVRRQLRVLLPARGRIEAQVKDAEPGRWYFAGAPLPG